MEEIERRRIERRYRVPSPRLPDYMIRLRGISGGRRVARFYADYIDQFGYKRRISFGIKVGKKMPNRALAFLIREVIHEMKHEDRVPAVADGEVLSSFVYDLFNRPWRRIRRLRDYKAGVVYAR